MKKIVVLLVMLLSKKVYAEKSEVEMDSNEVVDVRLKKGNSDDRDRYPRSLIPITCVYTDGMVQLTLLGDLGELTLTVTNQTTGEQWSAMNALRLQTSTVSGMYFVEIVTEDGTTYYGSYTL